MTLPFDPRERPYLAALIAQARYPLGPPITLALDRSDGAFGELATLLTRHNGLTAFNAGLQVFRAGSEGMGPDLQKWNDLQTWKHTYEGLADGLLCFAQDLFGVQFALDNDAQVVRFDPETAERTALGDTLEDWARWLLADPDVRGAHAFATSWQDRHGALAHDQRLIPLRFFTLGGAYEDDNLAVKDAAQCMRIRGPLAQTLYRLPDGANFQMTSTPPPSDPDLLSHHEFDVFADYCTVLIQDDDARLGEPERSWFDLLVDDWINTAPGIVGIGAARPFKVPFTVDVRRTPPAEDDTELQQADHVTQASLALPSGRLLISSQDFGDEPRIPLTPGNYAARIYSHGLNTLSEDALEGEDRYHVVLWPTDEDHPALVLKRYPEPLPGG
ncbi:SMI1/KNR4 family protein [Streptomyces inhibens]|uniref:SMI1/KNR4 family protein n=1 Tax=Streptomyces inhibens TaxID=2293571 RepID=UPI0015F256DB|nr:SMI1/KNR4 family protein [Streptomyces inhibens]